MAMKRRTHPLNPPKKRKKLQFQDDRIPVDKSIKNSYDAFLRQDKWTIYEILKLIFIGVPFLIPVRGIILSFLMVGWLLFTKLFVFTEWLVCCCLCCMPNYKRCRTIDDFKPNSPRRWLFSWLSTVSRFGLFIGGFFKIHRLHISPEQLNYMRYPIRVHMEACNDPNGNRIKLFFSERSADDVSVVVMDDNTCMKQNQSDSDLLKPCYTIVSNHISMLDVFINLQEFGPLSMLGKGTLRKIPIINIIIEQLNCLLYDHSTRDTILDMIKQREEAFDKQSFRARLIIYPEGTTTNGQHLIKFHRGAFANGSPVQPVVIHHPFKHFCIAWDCISSIHFFARILSQFVNYCTVIHFPPYHPSDFEKENPEIYAENVRRIMCQGANMMLSSDGVGVMKLSKCFFTRL